MVLSEEGFLIRLTLFLGLRKRLEAINMKRIKIGILGAGPFAHKFIPLFKAHPLVEDVFLAERLKELRDATAKKFELAVTFDSFEELLASEATAIGVFSQRWTHAAAAIKAMRAGKHVYAAVPAAITLEELEELISTVKETGQLYMLGETCYYDAPSIFCRKQYLKGAFGRFVFAQANYCHDMEHGFYPRFKDANGEEWKRFASFPPMLYPTHSVGQILGVTGGRMEKVACFGQVDQHEDGIFNKELSFFDNDFSNESALFKTSEGGMCRANEFRRVTGSDPLAVQGTRAAYINHHWHKHDKSTVDLSDHLRLREDSPFTVSEAHDAERLPKEFHGHENIHGGSHHFLADDFVQMLVREQLPVLNVWTAARFCAPGIVAHQSALRGGELLTIPDFGKPPEGTQIMDLEKELGKPALEL